MKTNRITKKTIFSISSVLLIAGIIAGLVAAFPSTAFAATSATDQTAGNGEARLTRVYENELKWLGVQEKRLDTTDKLIDKAQALIDKAKAKGWDVAELETALKVFKGQVANARNVHHTAAAILNAHKGFDANGKVTDKDTALQTVKDAGQSLKDARSILNQAGADLRAAIRNWRNEHKSK